MEMDVVKIVLFKEIIHVIIRRDNYRIVVIQEHLDYLSNG